MTLAADVVQINGGDTAWVLVSAALVMLMTPGLALFYGGMTRAKSVLNMMMMSVACLGIVSVLWVIFGFSEAFGNGTSAFIGSWDFSGLGSAVGKITQNGAAYPIPLLAFAMFQLMFAVITPALISGAVADRMRFAGWVVFVAIWCVVVYFPVAHWVFDFGGEDSTGAGWLAKLGVLDFAGGTAVHINAGAAGLALAIVLGRRAGWPKQPMKPHSLPLVLLGASLLWFGWFGFNAGSALGANDLAALAFTNTMVATAGAVVGWLVVDRIKEGRATSLGAASGAVAGLVAITPGCAFVAPWAAVIIGLLAGVVCAFAVSLKFRVGIDDSLDVVGVHLVGGLVGTLAIGLLATKAVNSAGRDGLLYGGGWELLRLQATGAFTVLAYSFVVTFVIGWVLNKVMKLRIDPEAEIDGIDLDQHLETAFEFGGASGALGRRLERTPVRVGIDGDGD
ncbi:MAG TPA: ammonia channel protein [Actinobacteria bacterium]|nr:ammonia channel protein [Actinomycetota bacterium]